jgi:hypothetical protein
VICAIQAWQLTGGCVMSTMFRLCCCPSQLLMSISLLLVL